MIFELYPGKLDLVSGLTLIRYQPMFLPYRNQSIRLQDKKDTGKSR